MAYIINISDNSAVTINLQQGRVQLNPKEYVELSPIDIEPAKRNYNSKEFGLCVVESEQELRMIIPEKQKDSTQENSSENKVNDDEKVDNGEETNDTNKINNGNEKVDEQSTDKEDSTQENSSENKVNNGEKVNEQLTDKEKAILDIKEKIKQYQAEGNLNDLKELATKLKIPYMYNISFEKLADKILMQIES